MSGVAEKLVRTKDLRIVTKTDGEVVVYSEKKQNPQYIQTLKIVPFWHFVVYSRFLMNAH